MTFSKTFRLASVASAALAYRPRNSRRRRGPGGSRTPRMKQKSVVAISADTAMSSSIILAITDQRIDVPSTAAASNPASRPCNRRPAA